MNPGAYDGYQAERAEVRLAGAAGSALRPGALPCHRGSCRPARVHCPAQSTRRQSCNPRRLHPLQLMEAFSTPGCNAVVLAGDSHNAWAHELLDERGRR